MCNSGAEANRRLDQIRPLSHGTHGHRCDRCAAFTGAPWAPSRRRGNPKYREPFEPLVPGFKHIPYDNLEKAAQAIDENTAAVIIEIVQGEGGVRPGTREFIEGIAQLAHERGALVILDEVQTGFGRTGKMFAAEHYDIEPDLISVAKSIAGGLPMGAVLISERIRKLDPQMHGTTFGGSPLICAAANATIDFIVSEDLPARAAELGEYAMGRLEADRIAAHSRSARHGLDARRRTQSQSHADSASADGARCAGSSRRSECPAFASAR